MGTETSDMNQNVREQSLWQQYRRPVGKVVTYGVILLLLAIVLAPLYWMLVTSVQTREEFFRFPPNYFPAEPVLTHYQDVLFGKNVKVPFLVFLKNSFIVASGTTLLTLALAIPAGYGFSRFRFTGRRTLMYFVIMTQMFPAVMLLISYYIVFQNLDMLDSYLALIFPYLTFTLPFSMWMLKGYFDKVPTAIEEAALIDGATPFQALTRILIPTIIPGILATAIFSFLMAWDEFILALTLNTENTMYTLPPGLQMSFVGQQSIAWGSMMAASAIAALPVIVLFIVLQRYLVEGLTAGAVKE